MATRRDSQPGTGIKVVAGAVVGIGCAVAMRELTDWAWWIRYPLILAVVFVAAVTIEAIRDALARRSRASS